ncbi:MAG: hypothetical protein IPG76_23105 [Acidobacteria bacterium]|nr:hypothetical protein [Acidobacteriota bacterium]
MAEDPLKTEEQTNVDLEWNSDSAELAYSVIARYVEHTQVSCIIIALMVNMPSAKKNQTLLPTANTGRVIWSANASITEAKLDVDRLTGDDRTFTPAIRIVLIFNSLGFLNVVKWESKMMIFRIPIFQIQTENLKSAFLLNDLLISQSQHVTGIFIPTGADQSVGHTQICICLDRQEHLR